MYYYDISCFRYHDKEHPSHIVYRLKFSGDDNDFPTDNIEENPELAKKILLENKENKNAETALTGHYSRFKVLKYTSYF